MKFDVIYADPPWRYSFSRSSSRKIENHYPTMTNEEIKSLPVADLAAADAVLALWVPATKLDIGVDVVRAWGARFVTSGAWDKAKIGMGYWLRGVHEILMIGAWGKPKPPPVAARQHSLQMEARSTHSKKPACWRATVEGFDPRRKASESPPLRLELFSRDDQPGWIVAGNAIDGRDIRAAISALAAQEQP